MEKFNNLQGLRTLGFIFIFLNHTWGMISPTKPFGFGSRGVEIFFILSGFLIAYHYSDKNLPSSWRDSLSFMLQRLKKFYILHFITFLVMLAFFLYKFYMNGNIRYGDWQTFTFDAILNITLLQSWYAPAAFSFNGVSWFLSDILFLYFLIPKTVQFFKDRKYSEHVVLFVFLIAIKLVLDTWGNKMVHTPDFFTWYLNPTYRFLDFLIGYSSCLALYKADFKASPKVVSAVQIASIVIYLCACYFFKRYWLSAHYILLTLILIYACTLKNGILDYLLGNPLAVHMGNISFELYLIHNVVIGIAGYHISKHVGPVNIPQQVYRLSEKAVPPFRGKCTAYPPRCTAHSLGYDVKII